MKLYYHRTSGGAEYYSTTYIETPDGGKEGRVVPGLRLQAEGITPELLKFPQPLVEFLPRHDIGIAVKDRDLEAGGERLQRPGGAGCAAGMKKEARPPLPQVPQGIFHHFLVIQSSHG